MTDRVRAIILCEDRQQEVFARTFLLTCGIRPIRVHINPRGKGSGEQFVRQNYLNEVSAYRSKRHSQPDLRLVVVTDADELSVKERYFRLNSVLIENHLSDRQEGEGIGIFIPKRNIETWIYYLKGQPVNEQDIYSHLSRESECKTEVHILAQNRRKSLPESAPPSLITACEELNRIISKEP